MKEKDKLFWLSFCCGPSEGCTLHQLRPVVQAPHSHQQSDGCVTLPGTVEDLDYSVTIENVDRIRNYSATTNRGLGFQNYSVTVEDQLRQTTQFGYYRGSAQTDYTTTRLLWKISLNRPHNYSVTDDDLGRLHNYFASIEDLDCTPTGLLSRTQTNYSATLFLSRLQIIHMISYSVPVEALDYTHAATRLLSRIQTAQLSACLTAFVFMNYRQSRKQQLNQKKIRYFLSHLIFHRF